MSKLDVVHVTTVHQAIDARIFYKECASLHKHGLKAAVVGPHFAKDVRDGIPIFPLRKPSNKVFRLLFSPFMALFVVIRLNPKIVHFHDPEIIPVAVLLRLMGKKVIYDVHEHYLEIKSLESKIRLLNQMHKFMLRIILERVPSLIFNALVFPTLSLSDAVAGHDKRLVLVNFLGRETISKASRGEQFQSYTKKEYDVVFMGSISLMRAAELIKMFEIILKERPNSKFLLLGMPAQTVAWIKDQRLSRSLKDSIFFHEKVPHLEVFKILSQARVGFNYHPMKPRFKVAIPMKVYEYIAAGLPVVSSSFPELESQFRQGEVLLVKGDNQTDYAHAVLKLLESKNLQERMSAIAYKKILEELNWEAASEPKLIALYQHLLAKV